jgi:hypothetical protein
MVMVFRVNPKAYITRKVLTIEVGYRQRNDERAADVVQKQVNDGNRQEYRQEQSHAQVGQALQHELGLVLSERKLDIPWKFLLQTVDLLLDPFAHLHRVGIGGFGDDDTHSVALVDPCPFRALCYTIFHLGYIGKVDDVWGSHRVHAVRDGNAHIAYLI